MCKARPVSLQYIAVEDNHTIIAERDRLTTERFQASAAAFWGEHWCMPVKKLSHSEGVESNGSPAHKPVSKVAASTQN